MEKEKIFRVTGYALLIFWLIFTGVQFYLGFFAATFWFCNIILAFLVVACFERNLTIIYFVFGMGLVFETPWVLDWIIFALFDTSALNLNNFYNGLPQYFMFLTFVRHIFTVPVAFFLMFLLDPNKLSRKNYLISLGIIFAVMVLSYLAGEKNNINCSRYSCFPSLRETWFGFDYFILWTALVLVVSFLIVRFVSYPIHVWVKKIRLV